ncbi:carboxymuconolactone decarboxylase family protein [Natrononativus amylolyticus]|uniref:carboxymuconolactone decarboxylase family protein n=1 Tax=Natrononativus amylolyticus TaxID=2963434 RepID=UPI0020CE29CE|nr:carboxymuconolactone decarboxylase family protein [Natrononativus amylolyticus]
MSDDAYVDLAYPEEAPEEVKEIYREIIETRKGEMDDEMNLNKMWLAYGTSPDSLAAFWPHMRDSYRAGVLPFELKSKVSLVTASVMECEGCRFFHTSRLAGEGVDDEEIEQLREVEIEESAFSEQEYEVLRFAETLATDHHAIEEENVDRLRSVGLSDQEIVELIDSVAIHVHTALFQEATGVVAKGMTEDDYLVGSQGLDE